MIVDRTYLQELIEKGKIKKALRAINSALSSYPEDENLLLMRAKCLLLNGDYLKVEEYAKGILNNQPENIYIQLLLINSLLGLQKFDEGLDVISNVLAIDPKSAKAYWYQSSILLNKTMLLESIESLDNAILLDSSNWEYYFWRGSILVKLNRRKEAYPDLKKAFYLHTNFVTFMAMFSLFLKNHPNLIRILLITSLPLAIIFHSIFFLIPLVLLDIMYLLGSAFYKNWKLAIIFFLIFTLFGLLGYFLYKV